VRIQGRRRRTAPTAKAETDVMTVRDLARYLNCHQGTVYRLLKQRDLPAFRLGGSWRFRREQIDEWIANRTKVSRAAGTETTDNRQISAHRAVKLRFRL
jgi:excisionase family DNA binding protein